MLNVEIKQREENPNETPEPIVFMRDVLEKIDEKGSNFAERFQTLELLPGDKILLKKVIKKLDKIAESAACMQESEESRESCRRIQAQIDLAAKKEELITLESTGPFLGSERFTREIADLLNINSKHTNTDREIRNQFYGYLDSKRAQNDSFKERKQQEAERPFAIVTVGMEDLARFNMKGHEHGDNAIAYGYKQINTVIRDVLGIDPNNQDDEKKFAEQCLMYRLGGTDVTIILKGDYKAKSKEIVNALSREKSENQIGVDPHFNDDYMPPFVSFELQDSELEKLAQGSREEGNIKDVAYDAIRLHREISGDYKKFIARTIRFVEESQKKNQLLDKTQYENFFAKLFGNISYDDLISKHTNTDGSADMEAIHASARARVLEILDDRFGSLSPRSEEVTMIKEIASTELGISPEKVLSGIQPDGIETETPQDNKEAEAVRASLSGYSELEKTKNNISQCLTEKDENKCAEKMIEYYEEFARRDQLTTLEQKNIYYKTLKEKIEKNPENTAVVMIDMAFLKYFDNVGGSNVGDFAILKTASYVERAAALVKKQYSGFSAQAYRYGGDEFSVIVNFEDTNDNAKKDAMEEFVIQMNMLAEKETIPARQGESKSWYKDLPLHFNTGYSFGSEIKEAQIALEQIDQKTADDYKSRPHELVTAMADLKIDEGEKKAERIAYFVHLYARQFANDEQGWESFSELFFPFSKKSLGEQNPPKEVFNSVIRSIKEKTDDIVSFIQENEADVFQIIKEKLAPKSADSADEPLRQYIRQTLAG